MHFFFSRNPWAFLQGLPVNHRLGTPNEAPPTAKTSDMGPVRCLNLLGILQVISSPHMTDISNKKR